MQQDVKPHSLIDSHCHLDAVEALTTNLDQAHSLGICQHIVPAITPAQWPKVMALQSPSIHIALGTHPWYVENPEQEQAELLRFLKESSSMLTESSSTAQRPVAIGEIGLDFYPAKQPRPSKEIQLESFSQQLAIAESHQLPVIVHAVKAHNEVIETLKKFPEIRGVIHAFNGSIEIAQQYLALGFCFGAGPLLLKSQKLTRVFAQLPLANILLETDAPYMKAATYSSEALSNPLLILTDVAEHLARAKDISTEQLAEQCRQNTQQLFRC
ncbi:TatD family hydrolase [Reinekea thalattae]|uniref:TatD family deoxyribonuclease n=1 Tax=Reinekea thalattae TaxID=2593301 RepID=A0A5C8ZAC1_9GAMM|nr:TatD family hydrolase [Reinekea thalattae]TXR54133.1 TatD family deoxyribonuclease [Reinekea thalattae]